jgi:hypothetical protein
MTETAQAILWLWFSQLLCDTALKLNLLHPSQVWPQLPGMAPLQPLLRAHPHMTHVQTLKPTACSLWEILDWC